LIVVGIPAYNEEKNIAKMIAQIQEKGYLVVVCDDGSTDSTSLIAKSMGVSVINHPKNLGYGAAIRSLFLKAMEMDCDVLVTFDADGQHRVEDINSVISPISKDKADIVIGSRFLDKKSLIPKYREVGIETITKLTNISTNSKITDAQSGFRAYSKKAVNEIVPSEYGMGVSAEILIKADEKGLKITEVPIKVLYEGDTSTLNPVPHGLAVIISTMKFISIGHPLTFYGVPGVIFLVIGLFFIVWTIQAFTETRQVITNISLIGIGSTIFGMILLMTSIILYSVVSVVREKR